MLPEPVVTKRLTGPFTGSVRSKVPVCVCAATLTTSQAADDTRTAVTTSKKSSFVMAPWTRRSAEKLLAAGSGAGFHFARDARALDHDEARGRNVPLNRAR